MLLWSAILALTIDVAAAPVVVAAAPTRPGPTSAPATAARPGSTWPVTVFARTEYVDLREVARRFGLKAVWKTPGRVLELRSGNTVSASFEADSAETELRGVRVILGKGILATGKTLYATRLDVAKTIEPVLGFPQRLASRPPVPRTIVIDPGHGGWDPGKQNHQLRIDEKDATLDVAMRLRRLLEPRGYRVLLTRSTDKGLAPDKISDLNLRAELANRTNADLFISIHFNAVDGAIAARVTGTETYVMTPVSHASTEPESDRDMIRTEYPANRYDAQSTAAGFILHKHLLGELQSRDRGLKRARFVVLRMARCPAVLIESAYLSNTAEGRKIGDPAWRQQLAGAIANGIDEYRDGLAPRPAR